MKKSEWKRRIKDKVQNKIQESVEKKMENKTKVRTVREDKWERHEKETMKEAAEKDMKCPIYNGKEDTIEHVTECQTAETGVHSLFTRAIS